MSNPTTARPRQIRYSSLGKSASMLSDIGNKFQGAKDAVGSKLQGAKDAIGSMEVNPYDTMSGATVGGLGGAGLGAIGGLLKALFDKDDDGVMSTIGKSLTGAGIGGLAGAAAGGISSHMRRSNALTNLAPKTPESRAKMGDVLKQFTSTLGNEYGRATGKVSPNSYTQNTLGLNAKGSIQQALAPLLAASSTNPRQSYTSSVQPS